MNSKTIPKGKQKTKTKRIIETKNKNKTVRKIGTKTKIKTKTKTKTKTVLTSFKNKFDEYPYLENFYSKSYILEKLNKLKRFQTSFINYNPIKNKQLNKFNGRLTIFKEEYEKNKDLYLITDYFSQSCRVKCVNNLKGNQSPFNYFQKNKKKIYQEILLEKQNQINKQITYNDFIEYMYKNTKQCTNFNTTVVLSLLKLLKPKRFLDPSAGWGDRLIGAIAYGCDYTGIDPSNCMNPIYHKIIDELVPRTDKNRYNIIQSGFETAIIEEDYYDLVFTSPPFFDFEIYEQSEKQSIEKFTTLNNWLTGFLFPLTEKAYSALTINGNFGLYISDYTGVSFTKELFKYINENIKGFKYQGDIHFWTPENKKVIRTIFFWKKVI
jgi:hypothetical protein